jgi:hypothetical protein
MDSNTRDGSRTINKNLYQTDIKSHEQLMKDLNRQSIEQMKSGFVQADLSERKEKVKKIYISRGPNFGGAHYSFRCLPKSARYKFD